ncbi:hypothetical protein MBLNU459_g8230t2 [Dothideomycetes sp. NU459]
MFQSVLADRDTNTNMQTQPTSNPFETKEGTENSKPKSMDYHRQMMENKLRENDGQASQAYVSPSDAIMSPASQKLSSFKQRQLNKQPIKTRSLFAKTMSTREKDLGPVAPEEEKKKTEGED